MASLQSIRYSTGTTNRAPSSDDDSSSAPPHLPTAAKTAEQAEGFFQRVSAQFHSLIKNPLLLLAQIVDFSPSRSHPASAETRQQEYPEECVDSPPPSHSMSLNKTADQNAEEALYELSIPRIQSCDQRSSQTDMDKALQKVRNGESLAQVSLDLEIPAERISYELGEENLEEAKENQDSPKKSGSRSSRKKKAQSGSNRSRTVARKPSAALQVSESAVPSKRVTRSSSRIEAQRNTGPISSPPVAPKPASKAGKKTKPPAGAAKRITRASKQTETQNTSSAVSSQKAAPKTSSNSAASEAEESSRRMPPAFDEIEMQNSSRSASSCPVAPTAPSPPKAAKIEHPPRIGIRWFDEMENSSSSFSSQTAAPKAPSRPKAIEIENPPRIGIRWFEEVEMQNNSSSSSSPSKVPSDPKATEIENPRRIGIRWFEEEEPLRRGIRGLDEMEMQNNSRASSLHTVAPKAPSDPKATEIEKPLRKGIRWFDEDELPKRGIRGLDEIVMQSSSSSSSPQTVATKPSSDSEASDDEEPWTSWLNFDGPSMQISSSSSSSQTAAPESSSTHAEPEVEGLPGRVTRSSRKEKTQSSSSSSSSQKVATKSSFDSEASDVEEPWTRWPNFDDTSMLISSSSLSSQTAALESSSAPAESEVEEPPRRETRSSRKRKTQSSSSSSSSQTVETKPSSDSEATDIEEPSKTSKKGARSSSETEIQTISSSSSSQKVARKPSAKKMRRPPKLKSTKQAALEASVVEKFDELKYVARVAKAFSMARSTISNILKKHGRQGEIKPRGTKFDTKSSAQIALEERAVERVRNGEPIKKVAADLGIDYATIYNKLAREKIEWKRQENTGRPPKTKSKDQAALEEQAIVKIKEGKTVSEVAKELKMSRQGLQAELAKRGIEYKRGKPVSVSKETPEESLLVEKAIELVINEKMSIAAAAHSLKQDRSFEAKLSRRLKKLGHDYSCPNLPSKHSENAERAVAWIRKERITIRQAVDRLGAPKEDWDGLKSAIRARALQAGVSIPKGRKRQNSST